MSESHSPELNQPETTIHSTAEVSPEAKIGRATYIWNWVQVREGAVIGDECIVSKGAYIDVEVEIGNRVKIQNNASIFKGVTVEDGVFVGPHVSFTNDLSPRAVNEDFELKKSDDWEITPTLVQKGASIGANATILPGVVIGEFAMIGAGAVVTENVPDYGLVVGVPARLVGRVDQRGNVVERL